MCTAISFTTKDHYFGRNLDLEYHYNEQVVITPRRFPLHFRAAADMLSHAAMIGMATLASGYPLYYDAVNEHGVCMAGLSFPQSARYFSPAEGRDNITPYEFIPWVLGQCRNMDEVRALLSRIRMLNEPFSAEYPLSPLHWMIAWKGECVVVESTADGLCVYENPVRVMTNNPPFPLQLWHLSQYAALSPGPRAEGFPPMQPFYPTNGMGALGLPGDWSSPSRFVRAAFALRNAACGQSEEESVSQFFHILSAVSMPRGCVLVHGKPEITVYTSCCNADRGMYYYTTYENSRITAVDMHRADLTQSALIVHPLESTPSILQL